MGDIKALVSNISLMWTASHTFLNMKRDSQSKTETLYPDDGARDDSETLVASLEFLLWLKTRIVQLNCLSSYRMYIGMLLIVPRNCVVGSPHTRAVFGMCCNKAHTSSCHYKRLCHNIFLPFSRTLQLRMTSKIHIRGAGNRVYDIHIPASEFDVSVSVVHNLVFQLRIFSLAQ